MRGGIFLHASLNFAVNMNPEKPIPYIRLINNNDNSYPLTWETKQ